MVMTDRPLHRVSAYRDVQEMLRDPRLAVKVPATLSDAGVDWMLNHDGDLHRRLHRSMSRVFTPRAVAGLRSVIDDRVQSLVSDLATEGTVDVVSTFAFRLPIDTIRHLFGAPELDPDEVHGWWRTMMLAYGSDIDARTASAIAQAASEFRHDIDAVIEQRRRDPRDDVLSGLIHGDGDHQLTPDELVGNAMLVIGAGFETTMGLISNSIWLLCTNPNERARISADRSLVESAVDEVLRLESPIISVARVATTDLVIGEASIEAGDDVVLDLAGANRDPAVFDNPDTFDSTRTPNPHLAFGGGPHFCLGAALARLEGSLAMDALLDRLANLRLTEDQITWTDHPILRCPERLLVTSAPIGAT